MDTDDSLVKRLRPPHICKKNYTKRNCIKQCEKGFGGKSYDDIYNFHSYHNQKHERKYIILYKIMVLGPSNLMT